jgi:putative membrane protein
MLRTPIPLGYTRYSVRFLWIWLTLLPFALVRTFKDFGVNTWWEDKPQPVLVLAMFFIGFIFLSIEDIAVQIEEPFAILPLELHQNYLEEDVNQANTLMDWSSKRRREQQERQTSNHV